MERAGHGKTIFADGTFADVLFPKDGHKGRRRLTVLLYLGNDQLIHVSGGIICFKFQVQVDGEPLGRCFIDQGNTAVVNPDLWPERGRAKGQLRFQKVEGLAGLYTAVVFFFDPCFDGTSLIIFELHLQESKLAFYVGSVADLIAVELPAVVPVIKVESLRIVVQGFVAADAVALHAKHLVVRHGLLQQAIEGRHMKGIFGIRSVHELHVVHFGQADGLKGCKDMMNKVHGGY